MIGSCHIWRSHSERIELSAHSSKWPIAPAASFGLMMNGSSDSSEVHPFMLSQYTLSCSANISQGHAWIFRTHACGHVLSVLEILITCNSRLCLIIMLKSKITLYYRLLMLRLLNGRYPLSTHTTRWTLTNHQANIQIHRFYVVRKSCLRPRKMNLLTSSPWSMTVLPKG